MAVTLTAIPHGRRPGGFTSCIHQPLLAPLPPPVQLPDVPLLRWRRDPHFLTRTAPL